MERSTSSMGALIGTTIIAAIVTIVVTTVVALIVGVLFSMLQYYVGGMRSGVAIFFGMIVGGVVGVNAAKIACDAMLKAYHGKTIFIVLAGIAGLSFFAEVFGAGLSWDSPSRLGQMTAIVLAGWPLFWRGEDL